MSQQKSTLAYLLAASHSGSTLTAMLLSSHPEIASVGELKATNIEPVDAYLCSCHQRIVECPFWADIEQRVRDTVPGYAITNSQTDLRSQASGFAARLLRPLHRGPALELIRDVGLSLSPGWRQVFQNFRRRNLSLIEAITTATGAKAVVDSSKIAIRLKYLARIPEIDLKVIWLVRDGRGVSLAYKDPANFADARDPGVRGGGAGRALEQGRNVDRGAVEWVRCVTEQQQVLATLPAGSHINVRYEDVCTKQDDTLSTIYDFLGVSTDAHATLKSRPHHVIGNGMRLDTTTEVELDERWREALTESELAIFERTAGELNRSFGYT